MRGRFAEGGGPATAGTVAVAVLLMAGALSLTVAAATSIPAPTRSESSILLPAGLPNPSTLPISHFVVVTLENHAYDNYFGTYCTSTGAYCAMNATGIPAGTCVRKIPGNSSGGCLVPYNYTSLGALTSDPPHDWGTSHTAYDSGSMDGFYLAANRNPQVFGHFNGSTIPLYWDLAEQYGLGDHFFSSVLSFSLPEHWDEVAQSPPKIAVTSGIGGNVGVLTWEEVKYLNEANATPSIQDTLRNTSVTWKYYDYPLLTYHNAINTKFGGCTAGNGTFNYWNPLAARAESYNTTFSRHFVDRSRIFADLRLGALPNVSWVIPECPYSDHPGAVGSIAAGQTWVARLVNALENSPEWNSTALFLTWDEYGGFYDHFPPPQVNPIGLGFRVPFLVVSAYARQNFVSHTTEYFQSYLHLIEWRFGIAHGPGMHAPLPLEYFNFSAPPRPPMNFSPYPNATYPTPLQSFPRPSAPIELRHVAAPSAASARSPTASPIGGWTSGDLLTYRPSVELASPYRMPTARRSPNGADRGRSAFGRSATPARPTPRAR